MTTRHLVPVRINDCLVRLVNAPGFDATTFARSLHRARTVKAGYFRITPCGGGRVWVNGGSHATYVVSRTICSCRGHFYTNTCSHRAAACFADALGIDITKETVLGFDESGFPVTRGYEERIAA